MTLQLREMESSNPNRAKNVPVAREYGRKTEKPARKEGPERKGRSSVLLSKLDKSVMAICYDTNPIELPLLPRRIVWERNP